MTYDIYADQDLRRTYQYRERARLRDWVIVQWENENGTLEAYMKMEMVRQMGIGTTGTRIWTADGIEWCWIVEWWEKQGRMISRALRGAPEELGIMMDALREYEGATTTLDQHFI